MGIQYLTSQVSSYKRTKNGSIITGSDVYIDGKNFVHASQELFNQQGALAVFQRNLKVIEDLQPHSITIYFDASFPPAKIPVKLERAKVKLYRKSWDDLTQGTAMALDEVYLNHPDVKAVMTGTEAEDQIFWDLAQMKGDFERTQVVISSDSDCFTFDISGSDRVFIVSLYSCRKWPEKFEAHNLSEVVKSAFVKPHLHKPAKPMGRTLRDCAGVDIRGVELVNMRDVYDQPILFVTLLPTDLADPWKLSLKWRKAAYAELVGDGTEVQEYRQVIDSAEKFMVVASDKEVKGLLKDIQTRDVVDIVVDHIEKALVTSEAPLDDKATLRKYLKSLEESNEFNIRAAVPYSEQGALYSKSKKWCLAAASTFSSIRLFASACKVSYHDHRIGWKLNPKDLYQMLKKSEVPDISRLSLRG